MFSSRVFLFLATLGLIAALTVPVPVVAQTVIYVDDDASGSGDGSESNPFSTLQAAFSEAEQRTQMESEPNVDEIRIAEGIYYPDEGSNETDDDRSASFELILEIPLKGGYSSDFSSRDPETNVTVLSGDIDQNDTTNENGVVTDSSDISGTNSYHVVTTPNPTPVTLSGLTITAGQANESDFDSGGGITTDANLTLRDIQISGNTASEVGGGVHVEPGSLSVENSTLRGNAAGSGGAVHVTTGGLRLSGVTVQNNAGGGVVGVGDGPASSIARAQLTDVTFTGNTGNGGLNLETSTSLTLRSVTFENNSNTGGSGGGANLTLEGRAQLTDLTFRENTAIDTTGDEDSGGGGLAVSTGFDTDLTLRRSRFVGNEATTTTSTSDIDATVCFDIGDLSFPVVDRSALNVYARSGPSATDWQERTSTELRPSAENPEQICATGQSSFSQFAVTAKKSELPVELAQFEAQTDEGTVVLSWKTASETNNAGFEVQHRTAEQEAWGKVGSVEGAGTTDQLQSYRFSVEEDLSSGTHHFRLRQVDIDGTAHLSDVVTVDLQMQQPVRLTAPAPNPVSGRATLSFAVKTSVETTLRLYNVLGQQVATLYRGTPAAEESQTVDLSAENLSSGVYFLRLRAGERSQTQRLTIVR